MAEAAENAQILVFGGAGQVGRALKRACLQVIAPARTEVDLTDREAVRTAIDRVAPRAIINAAAWTAVDAAEADEEAAFAVNALGAGNIAEAAADQAIPLVHISTDYVFEGGGTAAWAPDDPTGPLGAYGRTKLAGEGRVQAAGGPHVILRTSWVFSADGANFVRTMLRLSETRDKLTVVADQVGGPTAAADIAGACLAIADQLAANPKKSGIYHFSGRPDVSWAEFARSIFESAACAVEVVGIPASDYPTPAVRPLNSRLDCSRTRDVFGIERPDWHAGLQSVLEELRERETSGKEADE